MGIRFLLRHFGLLPLAASGTPQQDDPFLGNDPTEYPFLACVRALQTLRCFSASARLSIVSIVIVAMPTISVMVPMTLVVPTVVPVPIMVAICDWRCAIALVGVFPC